MTFELGNTNHFTTNQYIYGFVTLLYGKLTGLTADTIAKKMLTPYTRKFFFAGGNILALSFTTIELLVMNV